MCDSERRPIHILFLIYLILFVCLSSHDEIASHCTPSYAYLSIWRNACVCDIGIMCVCAMCVCVWPVRCVLKLYIFLNSAVISWLISFLFISVLRAYIHIHNKIVSIYTSNEHHAHTHTYCLSDRLHIGLLLLPPLPMPLSSVVNNDVDQKYEKEERREIYT